MRFVLMGILSVLAAERVAGCVPSNQTANEHLPQKNQDVIVAGMPMSDIRQILEVNRIAVREVEDASAAPQDQPAQKLMILSPATPDALVLFGWSEPAEEKKVRTIYWYIDYANDRGPKALRQDNREYVKEVSIAEIRKRLKLP